MVTVVPRYGLGRVYLPITYGRRRGKCEKQVRQKAGSKREANSNAKPPVTSLKNGVFQGELDSMAIKDLGRWESLETMQRYTRSVSFCDSLKLYKRPMCWEDVSLRV